MNDYSKHMQSSSKSEVEIYHIETCIKWMTHRKDIWPLQYCEQFRSTIFTPHTQPAELSSLDHSLSVENLNLGRLSNLSNIQQTVARYRTRSHLSVLVRGGKKISAVECNGGCFLPQVLCSYSWLADLFGEVIL